MRGKHDQLYVKVEYIVRFLPTGFFHAGDQSLIGEVAEAYSADAELTIDGSRTTAELASVFGSGRKFRLSLCFQYFCFTCHSLLRGLAATSALPPEFQRIITAVTGTSTPRSASLPADFQTGFGIPSSLPTLTNAANAFSRSLFSSAAEICVRILASPFGTTGKKNPTAKTPSANKRRLNS